MGRRRWRDGAWAGSLVCGCCGRGPARPRPTWTSGWWTSCSGPPGTFPGPVLAADGNGSPASSFAVGAYLLEVVGEQGAKGPLAIVVDDLQWADRRSVEALTFMLRRLSVAQSSPS